MRASSRVHVDADRDTRSQPRNAAERAQVESLRNAQQLNAQRLSAGDPAATALLNPNGVDAAHPNGGGTPGPAQAVKDFAVECEVTKWKQGMAAMRAQAINESPLGQAAQAQTNRPFTQLSQAEQQAVINDPRNAHLFGTPPPNPAQPGVNAPPAYSRAGNPPSQDDCRAYQGNYLAWQTANGSGGSMPGWTGRAPAGARPGTATGTAGGPP